MAQTRGLRPPHDPSHLGCARDPSVIEDRMAIDKRLPFPVESLESEYRGAELGDARRSRRLVHVAGQLAVEPSRSFPKALVSTGDLEAGCRFFGSEHVRPGAILAPHRRRSWERAASSRWLLSLEDTTEMRFTGATTRAGLGSLMNGGQGFYFHGALLATLDEGFDRPIPLGLVEYEVLVRPEDAPKRKWRELYDDPKKAFLRWSRVMQRVDEAADAHGTSIIHVADREASQYELLAEQAEGARRFIVRVRAGFLDRGRRGDARTGSFEREVLLSPRLTERGGRRRAKFTREGRRATLSFHCCPIALARPSHVTKERAPRLPLNLVEVTEKDAPEGSLPISWVLVTTESIATDADVLRVVDSYRARWLIEEYWKAIKTGCDFESRQLDSLASLENALAVFIPIAWQMLLLRGVVRDAPDTAAVQVVGPQRLSLLIVLATTDLNRWGLRLPRSPTARDVLHAIARMGGHLRNNGPPGWLTIRRGLDDLYKLAAAAQTLGLVSCDQS